MNFFNYYAAWDSDTSATEERGGGGLWGSAATAAWELFSIFPFVLSFPLVFFFFLFTQFVGPNETAKG